MSSLAAVVLACCVTASVGSAQAQVTDETRVRATIDDGLVAESADGNYKLSLRALARFRYQFDYADRVTGNNFAVAMMRPQLRVSFWKKKIDIFVQPELAGTSVTGQASGNNRALGPGASSKLLDAQFTWNGMPEFNVRVGQFVTPMTRDFWTPVPQILFPDFSIVNNEFRADRDFGAMIFGSALDGMVEYYAGAFNGQKLTLPNNDNTRLMYLGRIAINPSGPLAYDGTIGADGNAPTRFAIGINGYNNVATSHSFALDPTTMQLVDVSGPDVSKSVVGVDVAVAAGPFHAMAEGFYRHQSTRILGPNPSTNAWGVYGMAAVYVLPPWLEVATRVSHLDMDSRTSPDLGRTTTYEALLQYYAAGNHLRTALVYQAAVPAAQAQTTNHRLILQMQMW